MEKYLDRCLSSLVVHTDKQHMQQLEVLVVIDGGTDSSADIAKQYAAKHSQTFRVIEKTNGNYGSCVNRGLKEAQGLYIKLLDADDWFDTEVLIKFLDDISALISHAEQPDVIQHPFTCIGQYGLREIVRYNTMNMEPYQYGKVYQLDDILKDGYIRFFLMHGLAYRTALLRQMDYSQTEGVSYTDTEWACYPFYKAGTIVFMNHNLYQYESCREGQTTDPNVLTGCLNQLQKVTDNMLDNYGRHLRDNTISDIRKDWMKQYHANRIRVMYKHYLLDMPRDSFDINTMLDFDNHYSAACSKYGFNIVLYPENKLLRMDYIKYWHRHHRRWPVWLEYVNHTLDHIMKTLYKVLIRR